MESAISAVAFMAAGTANSMFDWPAHSKTSPNNTSRSVTPAPSPSENVSVLPTLAGYGPTLNENAPSFPACCCCVSLVPSASVTVRETVAPG